MRKTIIIAIIVILVIAALFVAVWVWNTSKPEPVVPTDPITFPVAGPTGTSTPSSVQVRSFLDDIDTYPDPVNPGYYHLGFMPESADAPYFIEYVSESDLFTISIVKEPIGENRRAAEAYLMQKLGLSQQQMCSLNYSIAVPYYVNETYSSINLGFSFCPGATVLP